MGILLLFANLEKHLVCKTCNAQVKTKEKYRLRFIFKIACKACKVGILFRNNKLIEEKSYIPEINRCAMFGWDA